MPKSVGKPFHELCFQFSLNCLVGRFLPPSPDGTRGPRATFSNLTLTPELAAGHCTTLPDLNRREALRVAEELTRLLCEVSESTELPLEFKPSHFFHLINPLIHQECNCSWAHSGGDETTRETEVQQLSAWRLSRKALMRTPSLSLCMCRNGAAISILRRPHLLYTQHHWNHEDAHHHISASSVFKLRGTCYNLCQDPSGQP